jgi:copper resistance protein C
LSLELIRRLLAGLIGVLALASPTLGVAHPLLLESSPASDATVSSPSSVALRFNNRIESRLSRVGLIDEGGQRQDLTVVPGDGADRLIARTPRLGPGRYRVEWRVLSADGHVVNGRFWFRVTP